jgi:hypothetical protein
VLAASAFITPASIARRCAVEFELVSPLAWVPRLQVLTELIGLPERNADIIPTGPATSI